jgi:hypothetical protein
VVGSMVAALRRLLGPRAGGQENGREGQCESCFQVDHLQVLG